MDERESEINGSKSQNSRKRKGSMVGKNVQNTIENFNAVSDDMYHRLVQQIDAKMVAVREEVVTTIRQEFQFVYDLVNSQNVVVDEIKDVLARSVTPCSKKSSGSAEEAGWNDTTQGTCAERLFSFDGTEKKFDSEYIYKGTLPLFFEIPQGMHLSEEAAVAVYLFHADGSPDETIVKHVGIDGCRGAFDVIKPNRWIDDNILTMVACTLSHEQKASPGSQNIWFLPPRVSEQVFSFCYTPRHLVLEHMTYLSDVIKLSKIYLPVKDNIHWYLLCVDVKKKKLHCIDSLKQRSRKMIRERQVYLLANFLDWMIDEKLYEERMKKKLTWKKLHIKSVVLEFPIRKIFHNNKIG